MRNMKTSGVEWMPGIPESWKTIRMPYAASVVSRDYQDEFDLLSVYLNRGVITYSEGGGLVHKPSEDLSKYQHVVPGDIVLNNQQAWRGSVGVSRHFGNVSPAYIVLRPTTDWHPGYLNYLLRSPFIVTQLEVASRGVGDIQRQLSRPWMRGILFPMPPLAEQRRIADFLDRETAKIDALIAKQEQLITTLDERRGAVISRAVARGLVEGRSLRDSGVDWLGEIPADWDVLPARALFGNPSEPSKPDDTHLTPSQNYGVLPQKEYMEISGSRVVLNLTGSEQMKHVSAGDFISHLRSFQGGLEYSPFDGKVSNAYTVLRPRRPLVAGYFKHLFKSTMYVQGLQTTTDQLRDGQSIRFKQLALLSLPEPPLEEQHRIADFLDRETAKIDQLRAEAAKMIAILAERRQALISAAVTGKLEVGV